MTSMYDNDSEDDSQSDYSDASDGNASSRVTDNSKTVISSSSDNKHSDQSSHFYRKRRKNLKVTGEEMLCVVCKAPSTGYNFNVISCESCKAFFRRNALKTTTRLTQCKRGGHCVIMEPQRKKCPACRLVRCLEMGMKRELITPEHKLVLRANYRGKRHQMKMMNLGSHDFKLSLSRGLCLSNGAHSKVNSSNDGKYLAPDSVASESTQSSNVESSERNSEMDRKPIKLYFDPTKLQPQDLISSHSLPSLASPSLNSSTTNTPLSVCDMKYNKTSEKQSSLWQVVASDDRNSTGSLTPHICAPKKRFIHSRSNEFHDTELVTTSVVSVSSNSAFTPAMINVGTQHSSFPILLRPIVESTEQFTQDLFLAIKHSLQQAVGVMTEPMRELEMIRCNLNTLPSTIESSFNRMEASIRSLIYAFKMIPQFTLLSKQTQMALLKQSMYGLLVFCGLFVYEPSSKSLRVTYYTSNGEKRQHFLDFETYLRRGFGNIQMKTTANKDSAFSPLASAGVKSLPGIDIAKLRERVMSVGCAGPSNPLGGLQALSQMSDYSNSRVMESIQSVMNSNMAHGSMPFGNLSTTGLEDKINMVVNLNQHIFEQVLRVTERDPMLIMALCTLRLFRVDFDSQMGRNCQYIIQRSRSEFSWFITQYASHLWAESCSSKSDVNSTLLTEKTLQDRLNSLFDVYKVISPLEKVGTLFDQFVNPNFVSPLMQDFLSPPDAAAPSGSNDINRPT